MDILWACGAQNPGSTPGWDVFFSPKYRGNVLLGDVAEVAEVIIRKTCKELDIEIIDMAVNVDRVLLFIKNPSQSVGHGWEVVERYISQKNRKYFIIVYNKKR
jgi:hypothetical protein